MSFLKLVIFIFKKRSEISRKKKLLFFLKKKRMRRRKINTSDVQDYRKFDDILTIK
jgi:hypothetical protein